MSTKWYVITLSFLVMIGISLFQSEISLGLMEEPTAFAEENELVTLNKADSVKVKVILEREYLDGELSQEVVVETIWSMEDFWAKYEHWQLIDMEKKKVVFRQRVDDISPLLKANGYFGITEDGILTIFNGRPHKYNIIQSFFQIDVGKLESRKREELLNGIPIKSKTHYVEVLETFKPYTKFEKHAN